MKQPYNTTIYNTALYLRLSRDDELQGESGSIQTQRMMLRQYAAEHGLTVVDEYIDDGWSGTNFERPSFQRMIDDIEDGKINCVVTKDLSQLPKLRRRVRFPLSAFIAKEGTQSGVSFFINFKEDFCL